MQSGRYIKGSPQQGSCESTPVVRGPYPESKGRAAFPLYAADTQSYHTIEPGEMILSYNPTMMASDRGGCTTSSFNGFDKLAKDGGGAMTAFKLTMEAHKLFSFDGFCLYTIPPGGSGSALRTDVIATRNNSGATLQLGQPVCWRCEDPQKIGHGKSRPVLVTVASMRDEIQRYESDTKTSLDPILRHRLLQPIGIVMGTAPDGQNVQLKLVN